MHDCYVDSKKKIYDLHTHSSLPNPKAYCNSCRHFLLMADNQVIIDKDGLPRFSGLVVALLRSFQGHTEVKGQIGGLRNSSPI